MYLTDPGRNRIQEWCGWIPGVATIISATKYFAETPELKYEVPCIFNICSFVHAFILTHQMPVSALLLLQYADMALSCPCSGGTCKGRAPKTHNQLQGIVVCVLCGGLGLDAKEEGVPYSWGRRWVNAAGHSDQNWERKKL